MSKPKILLQLDSDPQASVFDAVAAVDSGVDHLLQYHGVESSGLRELVYGAIFTRGPKDLKNTAVFIGGSQVAAGERLLKDVAAAFVGPMRVSVMMDANGANTTASAAVLAASRHVPLSDSVALVLAGTGPVGQRVARLLVRLGARVRLASRSLGKATESCDTIRQSVPAADLTPCATTTGEQLKAALQGVNVLIAAGAAGVPLVQAPVWQSVPSLAVAIDLNAVPPLGISGTEVSDKATLRGATLCYGAIGVGGDKMKIHKAALRRLFEANDLVLDAEQIFEIGQQLENAK